MVIQGSRPLFAASGAKLVTCQAVNYGLIAHRLRARRASVRSKDSLEGAHVDEGEFTRLVAEFRAAT